MSEYSSDQDFPEIVLSEQAYERELVIRTYTEAAQTERALRHLKEAFWRTMSDGTIIQIEADERHRSDGWSMQFEMANDKNLQPVGTRPPQPHMTPREQPDSRQADTPLRFSNEAAGRYKLLRYRGEQVDTSLFKEEMTTDGRVARGVTLSNLHLKLSILTDSEIAQAMSDMHTYRSAQSVLETTKPAMLEALRGISQEILIAFGATDIYLNKGNGSEYYTRDPSDVSFDFTLDDSRVHIAVDHSTFSVQTAYNEDYLGRELSLDENPLAAQMRCISKLPKTSQSAHSIDSEEVRAAFVNNGYRNFWADYSRLTEALPLLIRLLQTPVDVGHGMFMSPDNRIVITGPETLSVRSLDANSMGHYAVGNDGRLIDILPSASK